MARSDNWRINKSSLMAVEGAMILKALQKVAGAAGLPSGYQIKFATKGYGSGIDFDNREVIIGAGRLFHEAPITAEKMDVLVGLVLHEVGHQQIETNRVWNFLTSIKSGFWSPDEQDIFQKFVNVGEDIVVESTTRANPNLVEYDQALHSWAVSQMRDANPSELMELWIEYALGHKADALLNLPPELNDAMAQLVALTGWLRHKHHWGDRANAYLDYWRVLKDAILNPPEPHGEDNKQDSLADGSSPTKPSQNTQSESKESDEPSSSSGAEEPTPEDSEHGNEQDENAPSDESGSTGEETSALEPGDGSSEPNGKLDRPLAPRPGDEIDDELAKAIEDAIQSESEDISEQVGDEFNFSIYRPVIRSRETKTPLIKPNPELRKRLERVMTIKKRLQARVMRGEKYGRIDKRHLHRIATDEQIFNLKYKFPDGFPNCRILIDLSSSMSGQEADEVLEAASALQTLVDAEVWCYNNSGGKTNLVRVDDGKLVHRFEPDGITPSGLAIVGVSLGMKKDGLVIHLTDGKFNVLPAPWNAHWVLKKRKINLVNLIWGNSVKGYDYDGMSWKKLSGLAEFPEALYQILIEQAELDKIGGKR